ADAVEFVNELWRVALREFHRAVLGSEKAGRSGSEIASLSCGIERYVVRHLAVGPAEFLREHRSEVGILDVSLILTAAHHQLGAATVVAVFLVERTNDRGVFHPRGHLRHQFGDLNAGDGSLNGPERPAGRRTRLRVKRLKLTCSAGEPEQDAALLLALQFR